MAYLILRNEGPGEVPNEESYFEFDPDDETTLRRIESNLAHRRTCRRADSRLSELCSDSFKNTPSEKPGIQLPDWVKRLLGYSTGNRKSASISVA
jgi:hypothetical protein